MNECIDLYFLINDNPRSFKRTFIIKNPDIKHVNSVFEKIKKKVQPDQRTTEWYDFRWNMLTASSIYKAIDTQAKQNELIVDKCKPIDIKKYTSVNTEKLHFILATNLNHYLLISMNIYTKQKLVSLDALVMINTNLLVLHPMVLILIKKIKDMEDY